MQATVKRQVCESSIVEFPARPKLDGLYSLYYLRSKVQTQLHSKALTYLTNLITTKKITQTTPIKKRKEKQINKRNKKQINHHNPQKRHKGVKKTKKQRNFNTEEHYKIENNHYHDYELQKPK